MDEPLVSSFDISPAVTRANAISVEFQFEAHGSRRVTLSRATAQRLAAELEEYLRLVAGSSATLKP